MNYNKLLFLISLITLVSCQKEDSPEVTKEKESVYKNGIFILNEGNFGSGNASVTFLDEENAEIEKGIFQKTNENPLGDTAQSLSFFDDLAFIVLNVSNKIEIVNRNNFENIATISANLSNPRYAIAQNGKLYVSNWGDGMDPDDDFIAVFKLSDFSFEEKIEVAEGPEQIIESGNSIYVAHTGGFSFNNIVSVIDTDSKVVEEEIEVGFMPNSMLVHGNRLWVLSAGKPAYADEETGGSLSEIDLDSDEMINSFDFPASTHPDHLLGFNGDLYYSLGKSVFKFDNSESLSEVPVFTAEEADILYGLSISDGKAYITSPNADFTGDGNLFIYNLSDGTLLNQFSTGINPNSVYFNE